MIIAPGTRVLLLRNVPLDNTYEHTIWFDNITAQANYFTGLAKYSYTDFTYQRVNKNTIRVGRKADDLYDCNYVMFQNTNFGSKWFYAFITEVEYVNNECSNVSYQIDVMQTWFFNYSFEETFVEREHSISDYIGVNIVPESVALGEYVFNSYEPVDTDLRDMVVIIAIVDTNEETDGTLYDGIYGSAELWVYNSTDVDAINSKINEYVQQTDAILSVYMCPLALIGNVPSDHRLKYGQTGLNKTFTYGAITVGDTLDGYTPKNNKLYTYPYNFFHVDNANGNDLTLRYEFFDNLKPVLQFGGTITQPVQVVLRACSYKNVGAYSSLGGYTTDNTESIALNGYPICSWNVDSYQAWVAQNSVPLVLNTLGGIASTGVAANYSANPAATIATGAIHTVTSLISQAYQASIAADMSKGQLNNGGANVAMRKHMFYAGRMSITMNMAQIIDDYFNMYGYATRRVKIPNRSSRSHWNYVKTVSCNIHGSIPADDMRKICEIYDAGITFWKKGSEIGNYSLDNRPFH